ncbi:TetR/AcrR family transcriptional regulator [Paramagnetospirillum magneticum]|uniref:Transcriptional regulator n=1 Tax=Paramagnetospirillum magneticum (strain ATCC 700264 / AMB-1) TaxID=342108 RepID=Q2W300_PARM1|nr:TetR/AcrR family transcriptional regulator [Paramagnetospirillum magneticum]BAE51775.1 Transcriptional regulator [Paramagnetospirillum magneticum AMB-1]
MRDGAGTKQKIHETALRLFVDKGVPQTTVRDLAKAAGIAEGTLYRHYASMNDLIWELFSSNYTAFAHRLTAAQSDREGFAARLEAIIAEFCRFFDAEPVLFRFLMLVQHQTLPRVANDDDNPVEIVHRLLAQAEQAGEIPSRPPGLAASLVLGLVLQPAFALVYGRLDAPFSQYAPAITAAALAALGSADHA